MSAIWLTTICANLCLLAFLCWRKGCRGCLWHAQRATVVLSLLMVFLYYWPGCSKQGYEWAAFLTDMACTTIDAWIAWNIILHTRYFKTATALEVLAVCMIGAHQHIKLNWEWAADIFRYPTGVDAYMTTVRFYSNLACLLAFALLIHYESDAIMRPEGALMNCDDQEIPKPKHPPVDPPAQPDSAPGDDGDTGAPPTKP